MTIPYLLTYNVIMTREGREIEALEKRLDVVIALLATIATKDENTTLRDKIVMLKGFGLRPSEIASVLNKKASYISKELSLMKGKK